MIKFYKGFGGDWSLYIDFKLFYIRIGKCTFDMLRIYLNK